MSKPPKFKVIVIDDKPEVCRSIAGKIDGPRGMTDPEIRANVSVDQIVIDLQRKNETANPMEDTWTFHENVAEKLDRACKQPPDLIILDFFYVNSEVAGHLKAEAKSDSLLHDALQGRVLSPVDLYDWIQDLPSDDPRKSLVLKNLFGAGCPVYLHSYTPEGMTVLAGPVDERRRLMARVIPNSQLIRTVDTRRVLFNDDVFDWPNKNSRYDSEYYPYQLAVYFDQVVEKEILRSKLDRLRYLRVGKTAKSVASIAAIGGGIGFAGAWIGDYVRSAFESENYVLGSIVGVFLLVTLMILGMLCPFLFERLMHRLLPDRDRKTL